MLRCVLCVVCVVLCCCVFLSVNLARGAVVLSSRKCIVKRLHAIQNLGAMDILCTDKVKSHSANTRTHNERHSEGHPRDRSPDLTHSALLVVVFVRVAAGSLFSSSLLSVCRLAL